MPTAAAGNPFFCDFTHPADTPVAQKHRARAKLGDAKSLFRKRFYREDRQNFKSASWPEIGEFFLRQTVYFYQKMENKADFKRQGPGIIIGRFGRKGDLIYYRRNSTEVHLCDLSSSNKIFDVLAFDGALHLHLTDKI